MTITVKRTKGSLSAKDKNIFRERKKLIKKLHSFTYLFCLIIIKGDKNVVHTTENVLITSFAVTYSEKAVTKPLKLIGVVFRLPTAGR